jgi:hypothetical protein
METQKRAAKGGEEGANGEWYEGGKFIATTEQPKGTAAKSAKPERKQQYAPYKWDVAPVAGQLAIFRLLNGTARYNRQNDTFEVNEVYMANMSIEGQNIHRSAIARYNAGQRWE